MTSAPPEKEKKERKEARRGEGDRDPEDDLDEPAETPARVAEGERQARRDDDDHRDDLGDRALDGIQDVLERLSQGMFEPAA